MQAPKVHWKLRRQWKKQNNYLVTVLLNEGFAANKNGLQLEVFRWVPGHTGIPSDNQADQANRTCSSRSVDIFNLLFANFKVVLKSCVIINGRTNGMVKERISCMLSCHLQGNGKVYSTENAFTMLLFADWVLATRVSCRAFFFVESIFPPTSAVTNIWLSFIYKAYTGCTKHGSQRRSVFSSKFLPWRRTNALVLYVKPLVLFTQVMNFLENIGVLHFMQVF